MATTIKLKSSSTAGVVPATLAKGEVALNLVDKKLFFGDHNLEVQEIEAGAKALRELEDVIIGDVDEGYTLVYDAERSMWVASAANGAKTLTELQDVSAVDMVDGSALVFDAASSMWVARTVYGERLS